MNPRKYFGSIEKYAPVEIYCLCRTKGIFFGLELIEDRFDRIQPSKAIGNVLWHRGNRICIHREKKVD
jgi:hypothetical protein